MFHLSVVGIGPGSPGDLTPRAAEALRAAEVIVGYRVYNDLVRPLFPDKEYLETPMTRERERCRLAIGTALSGRATALICSGDAGIYGMASLALEMADGVLDLSVEVIPGVTAALSGAALLGAPLGHDFAAVSLSDALTPWETIENRLLFAARAGFCLALYNPGSRRRPDALRRACDLLLSVLPPETACGVARSVGREGECAETLTLSELREYHADMFTTVFVGSRTTRVLSGRLVTPRGYRTEGESE